MRTTRRKGVIADRTHTVVRLRKHYVISNQSINQPTSPTLTLLLPYGVGNSHFQSRRNPKQSTKRKTSSPKWIALTEFKTKTTRVHASTTSKCLHNRGCWQGELMMQNNADTVERNHLVRTNLDYVAPPTSNFG